MRLVKALILSATFHLFAVSAHASLVLSAYGTTVADSQGVTWLADGNLAATQTFGVARCSATITSGCINANGSMDYAAAVQWVAGMNGADYLGHSNWQLPTTGAISAGCTALGAHQEGFAYNCYGSPLGSLYYQGLGLTAPTSVTSPTQGSLGSFKNLQANFYWSDTQQSGGGDGVHTFSFATGWRGSNQGINSSNPVKGVVANFFYILPMIPHQVQDLSGGQLVYDSTSQVTWLADGNIAADDTFNLPVCDGIGSTGTPGTPPCVNRDGTMTWTSALAFIDAMNAANYLGHSDWALPPSTEADNCKYQDCATHPAKDPMASLYYNYLGLSAGDTVAGPMTSASGPFIDLQPYLYWSCDSSGDQSSTILSSCSANPQCTASSTPPCPNDMEWSFNFGDGFQGTDEEVNTLFATAYFVTAVPEPTSLALFGIGLIGIAGFCVRRSSMSEDAMRLTLRDQPAKALWYRN